MANNFGYKTGKAVKALEFENHYLWDASVIEVDGQYHMFKVIIVVSSREIYY